MKKIIFLVLILASISSCKNPSGGVSVEASVRALAGEVFLLGKESKIPLKAGDPVNAAAKIETGANSFVDITFGENIIRVLENSTIDIKELTEKTEFFLSRGGIFSKVVRKLEKDDSYIVRTLTSTAAVRGTDFLVSGSSDTSLAACLNGKISVSKADDSQTADVDAGQEIAVESGKPFQPRELSAKNRNKMRDILSDLRKDSTAAKIVPYMPSPESKRIYKVQVGAYIEQANAKEAAERLRRIGYKPVTDKSKKYYHVVITDVKAGDMQRVADDIGRARFTEGWLRD
ncbi:MAG: FecR domain-containing protein [Spirochaetes bacterium]|nr:FecR domain-containing protein [Spirochaetota bacterium]